MKVCSVIVTYGDRFHLLKQVIDACLQEGIDKIIVVDNASAENSRRQLKEYEKQIDKLKVIYLDENTGSAGGYKRGLQEAYNCDECEYIWLLDDDNVPQKDSLNILKEFWENKNMENKVENLCLLSFRPDRKAFIEAIVRKKPALVLGRKNAFLGLDILDIPEKVIRVLKRKIGISLFKLNDKIKSGKVVVAPYGGMFFNTKLIDNIGLPKEEYFLYADDHEWSYRITKNGGSIYLIVDSKVIDIDDNLNGEKSTSMFDAYINKNSDFKVFYAIRNKVAFENEMVVENRIIFKVNKFLFLLFLLFFRNKQNMKRYHLIIKAINNGLNNNFKEYKDEI